MAVARALELLVTRQASQVLVGGVDTYWDALLLAHLDAEERLKARERLSDGFTPGEGAAFLLLGRAGEAAKIARLPLARILGAGRGREPGHRYSPEPYLGEGLAQSFQHLFERLPASIPKVGRVYAGFNGESFWTKEWGVAYLRHSRHFEPGFRIEHPAEFTGDLGAALGPVMLVAAALGLHRGYRQGTCLVWSSSDREERAAVMIQAAAQ
jgi:3-oxoacyl-[acyl-carrier-protein] synthase-1